MFVGRKKEINELSKYIDNNKSILVFGLRRVGKTTLIKEVMKRNDRNYVYYECIKASESQNVSYFIELLKEKISFPNLVFNDFLSIFNYLNKNYSNYTFIIDEYSYLKEYYITSKKQGSQQEALRIDSSFQKIIDEYLENNSLVLCGSSISIMKGLIDYNSPLYDRFSYILHLKEFSYYDLKYFFPNLDNKKLIEIYSIFGGSPNVLNMLSKDNSLEDNIKDLLLDENSKVRNHITINVISELYKDSDLNTILNIIKNGTKNYSDISNRSKIETSGLLDKKLKKLVELDLIERVYPINMENNNKKCQYEIKDNLLKFYYTYVYGKESILSLYGKERFYSEHVEKSLNEFISRRFERIVRDYFAISIKNGKYKDIINIGSYFSCDSEFDCVLKKSDSSYIVFEVKYYDKPISAFLQRKEITSIEKIKGINVTEIGFVASNGVEEKIEGIKYLELDDLFNNIKE